MSDKKIILLSQEDLLTQMIEIALRQKGRSIASFDNLNEALPFLADVPSELILDASFLSSLTEVEQGQLKEILLAQACPLLVLAQSLEHKASLEQELGSHSKLCYLIKPISPADLWAKLSMH